ncbi:MAG TPA: SpoIIE family protein phosphatase [Streptosporangiaceae bacterium]|nr:SpoIIE family protein phosphatase [Streptosporangiaceae bacterium]
MREPAAPADLDPEIARLRARAQSLRSAADNPATGLRLTLDAVLGELESAMGMLGKLRSGPYLGAAGRAGGAEAERRLLRAVFQDVPAPIFLLEGDSAVRRVNRQAATLLDMEPGSATGKPFTSFVEPGARRPVREQLAAVLRTGRPRRLRCTLVGTAGKVATTLTLDVLERPGDAGPLVMAVAGPANTPYPQLAAIARPAAGRSRTADRAIVAATARLDLMSAFTRLLFENAAFGESLMLRRCAHLLAAELTAWVIVDAEHDGDMRRLFVAGPKGGQFGDLTRAIEDQGPLPGSLAWEVHRSGRSQLITDSPDATVPGGAASSMPTLALLGVTSVLCAPLTDGERGYGTLTLARRPEVAPFAAADLELVDEICQQLAVAVKIGRMFMRRSVVAEALQASLLPRDLPAVPSVEIATAYVASTQNLGVGGDFYDVYPSPGGWGLLIGDVCGRGEQAAAASALARYAIRICAHWNPQPADVLRLANEVVGARPEADEFVTASAARLGWQDEKLHVVLASAGQPGPLLVRPDGRVRPLAGGGLPLGFFEDARPSTEQLELEPGDLLFLYSDGVTEARDAAGNYFERGLADELSRLATRSASEIVASVRDRVLEFSDNDLRDDVTMVALRVLEPPDDALAHPPDHPLAGAPTEPHGARPGRSNRRNGPADETDQP